MSQIWNAVRHAVEDAILIENVLLLSAEAFAAVEKVLIDYVLFEKSHSVVLLPRNFAWSDVGNWAFFMMLCHIMPMVILAAVMPLFMIAAIHWSMETV